MWQAKYFNPTDSIRNRHVIEFCDDANYLRNRTGTQDADGAHIYPKA